MTLALTLATVTVVRAWDAAFYSVPGAIAVAAAVLAWRAFHDGEPPLPTREEVRITLCDAGRHLCRSGGVLVTTGEERADSGDPCVRREVGRCAVGCVADEVTMAGVDEGLARRQLCDIPERAAVYAMEERSFLQMPVDDAASCEGDGFYPTADGVAQCILRSARDPVALGVVVSSARCRFGVVPTVDRTPRLVSRDQAIALWCRRDAVDAGATGDR